MKGSKSSLVPNTIVSTLSFTINSKALSKTFECSDILFLKIIKFLQIHLEDTTNLILIKTWGALQVSKQTSLTCNGVIPSITRQFRDTPVDITYLEKGSITQSGRKFADLHEKTSNNNKWRNDETETNIIYDSLIITW